MTKAAIAQLTDNELVARIVNGNGQQRPLQEALYDRYAKKVFYKCVGMVKDGETAKDLMHDIMIKILTNLHKFKGTADFSFWVRSISYNYCVDYLKKKKRIRTEEMEGKYEELPDHKDEYQAKLIKEARLTQLEQLLQELKPTDKAVLVMRYQDGMSVKKIAAALQIGESAVKMRLKRSRDRLAELVTEQIDEHS